MQRVPPLPKTKGQRLIFAEGKANQVDIPIMVKAEAMEGLYCFEVQAELPSDSDVRERARKEVLSLRSQHYCTLLVAPPFCQPLSPRGSPRKSALLK